MKGRQTEKGMALLLVLVVVALLTSLLTDLAFSTMVDMRLTETFRDSTKAYYLAKGGLNAGRMILQGDKNSYDSRREIWGMGIVNYPVGGGNVSVSIEDQDGKLSLNDMVVGDNPQTVMVDRFYRLMVALDLEDQASPAELTAALVDWLDSGDTPYAVIRTDEQEIPVAGAEESYYRSLSPAYHCKNGPLETLQELSLVKGFTPDIVKRISPYLAVNGNVAININTASAEVLMSLDQQIDRDTAQAIIDFREKDVIKDVSQLQVLLDQQVYAILGSLFNVDQLGTKSKIYRIESIAMVNDGNRRLLAEVNKSTNKLLYLKVN